MTLTRGAVAQTRQNTMGQWLTYAMRRFSEGNGTRISTDEPGMRAIAQKAASIPATVGDTVWAGALNRTETIAFFQSAPSSVLGALINRGVRPVDTERGTKIPGHASPSSAAQFIAEAAPIPFISGTLTASVTMASGKLAVIVACSIELLQAGAGVNELLASVLNEALALGVDMVLLSDTAGTASRPPGLGYGAQVVTGSADIVVDVKSALEKLPPNAVSPVWMVHPSAFVSAQAASIASVDAGQAFIGSVPAAVSTAVNPADLWLMDSQSLVVNVNGVQPEFEAVTDAIINMSDDPAAVVDDGGVLAMPVRSLYDEYLTATRAVLPLWWGLRDPERVVHVTGGAWNAPAA